MGRKRKWLGGGGARPTCRARPPPWGGGGPRRGREGGGRRNEGWSSPPSLSLPHKGGGNRYRPGPAIVLKVSDSKRGNLTDADRGPRPAGVRQGGARGAAQARRRTDPRLSRAGEARSENPSP